MSWWLSPLAWMLLAGALSSLAWPLRRARPRLLAVSAVLVLVALAAMTPLVANALVVPLERPLPARASCRQAPPATALVLGAGVDWWPRGSGEFTALNLASRRRVERAVAWQRERSDRELVLVGGRGRGGAPALAELMAAYARVLGAPERALRLETDSDDTWENARHSAAMVPRLPRRIVLVTSAMHMPRAQAAFASAGFDACPLAADMRRLPSRLPWALVPRSRALERTEAALHEWAGLAYYRWRAR